MFIYLTINTFAFQNTHYGKNENISPEPSHQRRTAYSISGILSARTGSGNHEDAALRNAGHVCMGQTQDPNPETV